MSKLIYDAGTNMRILSHLLYIKPCFAFEELTKVGINIIKGLVSD